MKILQVIHDFLPDHAAGSEVYTAHLAHQLRRLGHEVVILTTEKHDDRLQYQVIEREHQGLRVVEVVYNRVIADLEESYDDPGMEAVLRRLLVLLAPDLVHVQSLVYFGVGLLRATRALAIPTVMTLHEYHLLCPRAGLLYDVDGQLCEQVDAARCSRCVAGQPLQRSRYQDGDLARTSFAELGERRFYARAVERRLLRTRAAFAGRDAIRVAIAIPEAHVRRPGLAPDRIRHVPESCRHARGAAGLRAWGRAAGSSSRRHAVGAKGVHLLVDAFTAPR
ncbi:MAG: glycosyltransferase [Planctomycetota bacterium]